MSNYIDRGIIKWAPFDGLAGFNDLYQNLKYQLNKKAKPILSEEQLYYMDITLKEAINNHSELIITYYSNGYTNNIFGHITKVDPLKKLVFINGNPLNILDIVEIDLI